MSNSAEWTEAVWAVYGRITSPQNPLDPFTSLIAQVRNNYLKDVRWLPIWDELDEVLDQAAWQAAPTFDSAKGTLESWYKRIARHRAIDARNRRSAVCPDCRRSRSDSPSDVRPCQKCGGSGRVLRGYLAEASDPESWDRFAAPVSLCEGCRGEGVQNGSDCLSCHGFGWFVEDGVEVVQSNLLSHDELYAELETYLVKWLPAGDFTAFVRDFVATVRSLSSTSRLQMFKDFQLFSTDGTRTKSQDLHELMNLLGFLTPSALRNARKRIRTCILAVFQKHGVPIPKSISGLEKE